MCNTRRQAQNFYTINLEYYRNLLYNKEDIITFLHIFILLYEDKIVISIMQNFIFKNILLIRAIY